MLTREVGRWTEITTPYLDRHNDYIQIYAKTDDSRITLTDGGETVADLHQSGFSFKSEKRQEILRFILAGFQVEVRNDELIVEADEKSFALKKHNLIQAILSLNDMFFLSAPTVESLFVEDVARWLEERDIRYTERVKFPGRTGFDYVFDFVIPKSKSEPERIMRAINNPTKAAAQNYILAWVDTRENRPSHSIALAMLNDSVKGSSEDVEEAFKAYGIIPLSWSHRDETIQILNS
jgi:hypothetical protein